MMRPVLILAAAAFVLGGCATSGARAELNPVARLACDKDIVLLGELPSHGEATAFALKAAIVQDLVQSCGFDAVLFEAPIYDFIGFGEAVRARTANATQLDNAIGRFWLTRELAPFRQWLFAQATSGRLHVGGIDDQVSITSQHARARLPEIVRPECRTTVSRHLEWKYNSAQPFDAAEKQRLGACATATSATDPMLRNLHTYVDRQVNSETARSRDAVMFDNVQWHLSQLPRGSKVVVWTATVHAALQQGELATKPTGAYLAELHKDRVAAIGFTALRGQTSMAAQPPKPLADLPATSLEARSSSGDVAWRMLDRDQLRQLGRSPSRLFGRTREADWSDYFDAVIIIRDEVAPVFEEWRR